MPQIKTKVEKYNNDLKGVVSYNNKDYALDNLIVGEEVELEISKDKDGNEVFKSIDDEKLFNELVEEADKVLYED